MHVEAIPATPLAANTNRDLSPAFGIPTGPLQIADLSAWPSGLGDESRGTEMAVQGPFKRWSAETSSRTVWALSVQ